MNEQEKFEKAQKLSQKSGATFEDAKEALENCSWDMLDAMVYLEKAGKAGNSKSTSEYSSNEEKIHFDESKNTYESGTSKSFGETIGMAMNWFGRAIKKGMENFFVIRKEGNEPFSIPVTIFVILLVVFNGFAFFLLIVGLFCGMRYSFEGQEASQMNADKMNDMLNNATDKAQQFKKDVKDGYKNHKE